MMNAKRQLDVDTLRQAVDLSVTPLIVIDVDGTLTYANLAMKTAWALHGPAWRSAFPGFDPETVVGANAGWLGGVDVPRELAVGQTSFAIRPTPTTDGGGNGLGILVQFVEQSKAVVPHAGHGGIEFAADAIRDLATGAVPSLVSVQGTPVVRDLCQGLNDLIRTLGQVTDIASNVADGNLSVQITERSDSDALLGSLKRMVAELNALLHSVQDASGQLDSGSAQVNEASQSLAENASRSAASLQQIAATMEEISVQTQENARNATSALDLSMRARQVANVGDEQMRTMVQAMKEIDDASRSISRIIKVIDDIAFQTNLLALNAAVEAGRAGIHGRGFAVVAEEVRRLAARSAQAAKETTEMIEGSSRKVNQGREIAEATANSLSAIVQGVGEVSDLVGEIAAASQEQATGIAEVNGALGQVDAVTQHNTAKAEEMAAASRELSSHSAGLTSRLSRFRLARAPGGSAAPFRPQVGQARHPSQSVGAPTSDFTRTRGLNDVDFGDF